MAQNYGLIKLEKTVPAEVSKVWGWFTPFGPVLLHHCPMYESIAVEMSDKEEINDLMVGAIRRVTLWGSPGCELRERLDYADAANHFLLYSVLEQIPRIDGEKCVDVSGTVISIKLTRKVSLIDESPLTSIEWTCRYRLSSLELHKMVENYLKAGIQNCFDEFDNVFNAVVGKLFVKLCRAEKLITADIFSSDPYCNLKLVDETDEQSVRSSVRKWTKNPEWNENFEFVLRPNSYRLLVTVWDFDSVSVGGDDPMGSGSIEFDEMTEGEEKKFTIALDTKGSVKLTARIEMQTGKAIPLSQEKKEKMYKKFKEDKSAVDESLPEFEVFLKDQIEQQLEVTLEKRDLTLAICWYSFISSLPNIPILKEAMKSEAITFLRDYLREHNRTT